MKKPILLFLYLFVTGCVTNSLSNSNVDSNSSVIKESSNPALILPSTNVPEPILTAPNFPPPFSVMPSATISPSIPIVSYEGAKQLNTLEPAIYLDPLIAMSSQGNFVLAYSKARSENSGGVRINYLDSYARTFDNMGNSISEELKIKDNSRVNNIDIDNNGDFVISYGINGHAQGEAYFKKYNIKGNFLNENLIKQREYTINQNSSSNINRNSLGEYFFSWISTDINPQPYVDNTYKQFLSVEINTQKYDSSLKPISDIHTIKTLSNDLINISSKVDKNDNYYISWSEQEKINLIKFDKNAKVIVEKLNLFTNNTNSTYQNIAIDNQENLIICWLKRYDLNAVYIRKYDKELKSFKEERVSSDQYITDYYKPSITTDSSNNITIAWLGNDRPSGTSNILIRKYDKNLKSLSEETLINKLSTSRGMTYISTDKDDNLYIFFRSESNKCYLKKFDKSGKLLQL